MWRKSWSSHPQAVFAAALWIALTIEAATRAAAPALPWRWSNPLPHGNNIFDLGYHAGTYWEVTDRGQIYWSTNRVTWTPVASGTHNALRGLAFQGDEVLISGADGVILAGGQTGFATQTLLPATTAWLEGIAASDAAAVAVGDEGAIFVREANAWVRTTVPPALEEAWFRGVAFGNGLFVAVGENGVIGKSANGRSWQIVDRPVTTHLNRVYFANGAFYACGDAGVLLHGNARGETWSALETSSTASLYSYAAEPSGSPMQPYLQLLAGAETLLLQRPPDGAWLDQLGDGSLLPAPVWAYYASVWDGERFLAGGRSGMLVEGFYSSDLDGSLWFETSDSPRDWLWDITEANGQYISVGDRSTVLTSPNGLDWSLEYTPPELDGTVFLGVGGSARAIVAVGSAGGLMYSPSSITNILTTNMIRSLVDCQWVTNQVVVTNRVDLMGLLWHAVWPPPVSHTLQGVAVGHGLFVVVGDHGTVLQSSDASTWTSQTIPEEPNLSSVAAYLGGFVAVGRGGVVFQSPDAGKWVRRQSGTTNWLYRVRELAGTLYAVGQGGTLLASTNGVEWHARSSGSSAWLTDIHLANNRYYACGTQGTMLTSLDALQWEPTEMPTGKSLYSLASVNGQLICVGVEGVILRAITAPVPPPVITGYEHEACESVSHERFTLRGVPDLQVVAQASSNLEHWVSVGSFRFSDPEVGFELMLTNASPAPVQYFRFQSASP